MKINWKVRVKNPVWWAQMVSAIVMPLVVGVGFEWTDMTTWAALGETIAAALGNPVVFVAMLVNAWTVATDPTTRGVGDGDLALTYDEPQ